MDKLTRVLINRVCKSFEGPSHDATKRLHVLDQISFTVRDGEIVSLFGPNACGKTTLLNIIAGLIKADSGEIQIQRDSNRRQAVGFVFQNYAESLLPWRSAIDNVAFPLELHGVDRNSRRQAATELLDRLDITIEKAAHTYQLSGGQQQLIAIARALMAKPNVLVLDEPFGSLDFRTRIMMEQKLQQIHARMRLATIFVSHDIDEALLLADKFILLSSRPAVVIEVTTIDAPRPRPPEWVTSKDFIALKSKALEKFMQAHPS